MHHEDVRGDPSLLRNVRVNRKLFWEVLFPSQKLQTGNDININI